MPYTIFHILVAISLTLWFNIDSLFIKSWVRELARLIPRQPAVRKVVMLTAIRDANDKDMSLLLSEGFFIGGQVMNRYVFTSESITEGHPDKICDQIADGILDAALAQDQNAKMAVECTIKDDFVLIYGEANTNAVIDYEQIALDTIREIGYEEDYHVMVKVNKQSNEINQAVMHDGSAMGAGDQGIMFGYACDDTDNYMPAAIDYAHRLAKRLSEVRRDHAILRPDGKTQVSVEYENDRVKRIDTIVVSTQHVKEATQEEIADLIMKEVIQPIIDPKLIDENTKFLINPSGSFVLGGSFGDSGTTGRKIVVDTYGGMGRIGGGCFSSKDPSKVDRSAAYYCRYVAKNIVAHQLARKCEIQVAYAIGKAKPVSIMVDTFNTGIKSNEEILEIIEKNFNFEVANIIAELDLCRPIYKQTACYGHFGRAQFAWEKIIDLQY